MQLLLLPLRFAFGNSSPDVVLLAFQFLLLRCILHAGTEVLILLFGQLLLSSLRFACGNSSLENALSAFQLLLLPGHMRIWRSWPLAAAGDFRRMRLHRGPEGQLMRDILGVK